MPDTAIPAAAARSVLATINHLRPVTGEPTRCVAEPPPDTSPRASTEARTTVSWAPVPAAGA